MLIAYFTSIDSDNAAHQGFHMSHTPSMKVIEGFTTPLVTLHIYSFTYSPRHEISNNVVCVTSKASDQLVHMGSLIRDFASRLNIL